MHWLILFLVWIAALQTWAIWLRRRDWVRPRARQLVFGLPFLFGLSILGGAVAGAHQAFEIADEVTRADRQAIFSAGISEALNSAAFYFLVSTAVFFAALTYFTLRRR